MSDSKWLASAKLAQDDQPNSPQQKPPNRWLVWLAISSGWIFLGVSLYWSLHDLQAIPVRQSISKLSSLLIYLLLSHLIKLKPDYSNMGWLGGLVDNPFRISDDFNRGLIFLQLVLLPGQLINYSLVMSSWLVHHVWKGAKNSKK